MPKKSAISRDDAQTIALKALSFLLDEPSRINRFMAITGTSPQTIHAGTGTPAFLAGVLEYLMSDQSLLLSFSDSEGIALETVEDAGRCLEGFPHR